MTPQFIHLPSGLRVNATLILEYREDRDNPKKVRIWQAVYGEDRVPITWTEDMTASELDALLSPSSSPIISPVLELRLPKKGEAVMFQWKGKQRHGVVQFLEPWNANVRVGIISHGQDFYYLPEDGSIEIPELSK